MGTVTFNFSGEVALITGGSRGLGFEIAQAFGAAGATVVITARRQQWLNVAGTIPMGRIGKPGELAPTVLFLSSEGASYNTGQVIAIDGGRTAQKIPYNPSSL